LRRITLAEAILALVVILAVPVLWGAAAETRALFPVQKQGKYGFIDRTGKIAIEPRFESAGGMAPGSGKCGVVKIQD